MQFRRVPSRLVLWALITLALALNAVAQPSAAQSSSSSKHTKKPTSPMTSELDSGSVTNGVYQNTAVGLTYKVPEGWVLRTDELNTRHEEPPQSDPASPPPASSTGAKVLLAAFSRPPEAKGEEVNSSILIAAENQSSYPGLKEAVQYLGPVTEVAKAQGFTEDEEPYEIAVGPRNLVRADFHKDVGTRVMHQSTLVMLSHGNAISITIIAGTDDEVEDQIDALHFTATAK
jgi:hypothetical protein